MMNVFACLQQDLFYCLFFISPQLINLDDLASDYNIFWVSRVKSRFINNFTLGGLCWSIQYSNGRFLPIGALGQLQECAFDAVFFYSFHPLLLLITVSKIFKKKIELINGCSNIVICCFLTMLSLNYIAQNICHYVYTFLCNSKSCVQVSNYNVQLMVIQNRAIFLNSEVSQF